MSGYAVAAAAVVAAGTTIYTQDRQRKATHEAMDQQKAESDRQLKQQQQAFNKQNQQKVNLEGVYDANVDGGGQSTMITGAGGVNKNQLNLGGGSLLGGG